MSNWQKIGASVVNYFKASFSAVPGEKSRRLEKNSQSFRQRWDNYSVL
jgi:hypothetical protein